MQNNTIEGFQNTVSSMPTRNKSILDILTKLQDSGSKINRAVVKTATSCGCIKIVAGKQEFSDKLPFDSMYDLLDDHMDGELCINCKNALVKELGNHLFYLANLSNAFNLNMNDILLKEIDTLNMLGKFSLK